MRVNSSKENLEMKSFPQRIREVMMDEIDKELVIQTLRALDSLAKAKKEEGLRQRDKTLKEQKFLRWRAMKAIKTYHPP